MARELTRRAAADDGLTMVELMLALLILAVGILTTFLVFQSSSRASHVSEVQEAGIHLAQQEVERLESLSYSKIAMTSAPATSTNQNNPGYYVTTTPSAACPSFQWNQSAGATNATAAVVVNGCGGVSGGTVSSTPTTTTLSGVTYTVYDYVTWATQPACLVVPPLPSFCPANNANPRRVTVEVTNNASASYGPSAPALISAVIVDPHALPLVGNPNVNDPLSNPTVTCTDGSGNQVACEYGLGTQTPNTYYLTDTALQTANTSYTPPTGNNNCMHYTDAPLPFNLLSQFTCGGTSLLGCILTLLTSCPQPDLLNPGPPPSTILQEYNFSPNISSSSSGRVIVRDPNATGATPAAACGAAPSQNGTMEEFWATHPLSAQLNLSGNGGMTLYTNTLHGLSVSVTLCVGIYVESPVLGILDPLGLLGSDSLRLGVVAYTMAAWPAVPTPVSFTFTGAFAARAALPGVSLGVRVWVAASSGDDIVVQYDAPTVRSSVQINST